MSGLLRYLLRLPPRLQRGVAALGLLLLLMVSAKVAWAALGHLAGRSEALIADRMMAGRLAAMAELDVPDVRVAESEGTNIYLSGESEAIISADLQNHIGAIASARGINVTSVGAAPVRQGTDPPMIGVRIAMEGAFDAVHGVIAELEFSRPILFIERAVMRSGDRQQYRLSPSRREGPLRLAAELDVYAAFETIRPSSSGPDPR